MPSVLFVCLGNICRSPMAQAVFQHLVNEAGLADKFRIESAGTGSWHIGERPHRGTLAILESNQIACTSLAQQVTPDLIRRFDYVVAMDEENVRDLRRIDRNGELNGKLHLLLDFAKDTTLREVPDPYYDGSFDLVYKLVQDGSRGLLEHIRAEQGL